MSAGRQAVGRYQVVAELGTGGFATVYHGHDPVLGRELALKVLHPHLARDAEFRERFVREGRALARVRHPNVVQVHDAGEVDGTAFLAMEFVHGQPLDEVLARGPLPFADVLTIARQVAPALAAVHAAGLLHRDIKPANIIVNPAADGRSIGRVVLLDLGIARDMGAAGLTATGSVLGTPGYLAPEQAGPGQPGAATDVYQLAATLYALLAGRAPFEGDTARVLMAILHQMPPALTSLRPDVPAHAAAAIMRGLDKNPAARPAGPLELLAEMERAPAETVAVPATPAPSPAQVAPPSMPGPPAPAPPLQDAPTFQRPMPPPPPPRGRGRLLVVGGVAAAGAAVVAVVIATSGSNGQAQAGRPRPRQPSVTVTATLPRDFPLTALPTVRTASATPSPSRTVTAAATVRASITPAPSRTATATVRTATATRTPATASPTPVRMSLPTAPAAQVPIPAGLTQQEREVLTLLNRNGSVYAAAVRGPDVAPLREVFTGAALTQYSAEVQRLQAAGQYHVTGVVTISLTRFDLEGPDGASLSTREVWSTATHDKASGRRLSGVTTTYDEFYRFVRRDGRWLISENTYRQISQTAN